MDPTKQLVLLWTAIQICLGFYILFCWFGAAANTIAAYSNYHVSSDKAESFMLVWHSFMLIAISVCGTYVMKKHRTELGLGLFIGSIFIAANWTLCTTVLIGSQISKKKALNGNSGSANISTTSDILALLFSIFLLGMYGAMTYLLVRNKDLLLGNTEGLSAAGNSNYPNSAFASLNQEDELSAV